MGFKILHVGGVNMPKRKEPRDLTEKIRQDVLKEFTRVPGEDYEEWCEFVRYEVDSRLAAIYEERIISIKNNKETTHILFCV